MWPLCRDFWSLDSSITMTVNIRPECAMMICSGSRRDGALSSLTCSPGYLWCLCSLHVATDPEPFPFLHQKCSIGRGMLTGKILSLKLYTSAFLLSSGQMASSTHTKRKAKFAMRPFQKAVTHYQFWLEASCLESSSFLKFVFLSVCVCVRARTH